MEWVKLTTDYYDDFAIVSVDDAAEVMFTRGIALAGKLEQHGFIPEAMLLRLTRKTTMIQAKKVAGILVKSGLWERVRNGYQIVNFEAINSELEKLVAKKKRDRERKAAERAASRAASEDMSTDESSDSPAPCPEDSLLDHKSKSQKKNAAAATRVARGDERPPSDDLPPAVAILRSALDARKLSVRWDRLTADELDEIEHLIDTHGDSALVKSALAAYQPNQPPVYAKAWLGGWRALRAPGQLELVENCTEPGHSGTEKHCTQCASERLERKTP